MMSAAAAGRPGNAASWPAPGQRYRDPVSGAMVLVLTTPRWPGVLRCNGVPMMPARPVPCGYHAQGGTGAALRPGRLYRDADSGLDVRCLRGANGRLSYAGRTLEPVPSAG